MRGQRSALAMPNLAAAYRPVCPKCGDKTKLARVILGPKGFIREFFECAKCNHFWILDAPDPGQQAGCRIIGKKPE
jgi:hypothetical protein